MVTISLGWWVLPLIITLGSMGWAIFAPPRPHHGMDITGLLLVLLAVIVSLFSWLVWALLT